MLLDIRAKILTLLQSLENRPNFHSMSHCHRIMFLLIHAFLPSPFLLHAAGHYFHGACVRVGLDLDSGEVVTVCEWTFSGKREKGKPAFSVGNSSDTDSIAKQANRTFVI